MGFNPQQKEALRVAEYKALDTARAHIDTAKKLFADSDWSHACFLAMTAIEETGKSLQFQLASVQDDQSVLDELRNHRIKAMSGAVMPLVTNKGALARHGHHAVTGIGRIAAVGLLGEAPGEWMALRNRCLYVDVKMETSTVTAPADQVTREHAYLMIVAALESYAEIHAPDFSYRDVSIESLSDDARQKRVLAEIEVFSAQESGLVDLDRLDFIANPERVAALKEAVSGDGNWP